MPSPARGMITDFTLNKRRIFGCVDEHERNGKDECKEEADHSLRRDVLALEFHISAAP